METQQLPKTETPMTEKDRWLLAAAICSAIGTAITVFFRRKEVVDQRDNGSKNERNYCSDRNIIQIRKQVVISHSKSKTSDYETDTKQQGNSKADKEAEKGRGRCSQKNQQALGAC